jgi:hypothetical protein
MKRNRIQQLAATTLPALLGLTLAFSAPARAADTATEFPSVVPFELGEAEFSPGDSIIIQRLTGTSATIRTGETYCVEGTYTLASRDEADVAFYATATSKDATPTDPSQIMRIQKGSGTFRLVKVMRREGYLHVSFYPVPSGSVFGGVYFGQDKWVLHHKGWSYLKSGTRSPDYTTSGVEAGGPVSMEGPNRAILQYLGDPVQPPADMKAAYAKDGLLQAVRDAARNAGVTIRRLEIDDSEFPFLVGVVCQEGDYEKLQEQFRKMPGYDYGGSVGSHTCNALNLVPWHAFPQEASQRISHRLGVRMQVFQAKLLPTE